MKTYKWTFGKDELKDITNEFQTIDECIEDARKKNPNNASHVFVGEVIDFVAHIDIDRVLDGIEVDVAGLCGVGRFDEWGGYSANVPEMMDLENRLDKALWDWQAEHGKTPGIKFFENLYCYNLETGERVEKN